MLLSGLHCNNLQRYFNHYFTVRMPYRHKCRCKKKKKKRLHRAHDAACAYVAANIKSRSSFLISNFNFVNFFLSRVSKSNESKLNFLGREQLYSGIFAAVLHNESTLGSSRSTRSKNFLEHRTKFFRGYFICPN